MSKAFRTSEHRNKLSKQIKTARNLASSEDTQSKPKRVVSFSPAQRQRKSVSRVSSLKELNLPTEEKDQDDHSSASSRRKATRKVRGNSMRKNLLRNKRKLEREVDQRPSYKGSTPSLAEEIESQTLSLSLDDIHYDEENDNDNATKDVTDFAVVDPTGRKCTYTGAISKSSGLLCGHGRLEYSDKGEIFEGQFVHGFWTGYGRCIYTNTGQDYTGFFDNNIRHGHGVTKHQDGRIFEGTYSHGVIMEGKMTYQDGSTYLGQWSRGARHDGRGTYTFVNGSVFFGEFQADKIHGSGVLTWPNGARYLGKWQNGVRHGQGKEFRPDGRVRLDGTWETGRFAKA
jgi:hypothetical protein